MSNLRYAAAAAVVIIAVSAAGNAFAAESPEVRQMRLALRSIHTTERHLTQAAQDFDGHRAKALDLVKQAEAEVLAALPPRPPRAPRAPRTAAPPAAASPTPAPAQPAPAATPPATAPAAKP